MMEYDWDNQCKRIFATDDIFSIFDVQGKYMLDIITWNIDICIRQTGFINQQSLKT